MDIQRKKIEELYQFLDNHKVRKYVQKYKNVIIFKLSTYRNCATCEEDIFWQQNVEVR